MGAAAYNRGTQVIRRHADAAIAAIPEPAEPVFWSDERSRLTGHIAQLERELTNARACVQRLRVYRAADRAQFQEHLAQERRTSAIYRNMLTAALRQLDHWQRRAAWLRGLLVFAGVTKTQVSDYEATL